MRRIPAILPCLCVSGEMADVPPFRAPSGTIRCTGKKGPMLSRHP